MKTTFPSDVSAFLICGTGYRPDRHQLSCPRLADTYMSFNLSLQLQSPLQEWSYKLAYNWAHGAMIAGHPTSNLLCMVWKKNRKEKIRENYASSKKPLTSIKEKGPLGKISPFTRKEKGVWHNPTCSKKGYWSVSPLILLLLWTSGRGTRTNGHLILISIHESTTANAPLIIDGAHSPLRGPWSHIPRTSFPETCSLTFLVMVFAAWHASDFLPTLYELKQWLDLQYLGGPPLLVTCAMPMMHKMSSTSREKGRSFFTAPIHTWSLSAGLMRLCFLT